MMAKVWAYISTREPSAITFAIRAVIYAAIEFGYLGWSDHQIGKALFALDAVLTAFVRNRVTTRDTLERAGTSQAEVVAKAAINSLPPS